MTGDTEREVGDVPPDRQAEENPAGADPDTAESTDDGEGGGTGPTGIPAEGEDAEQGPSGPPSAPIPGGGGE